MDKFMAYLATPESVWLALLIFPLVFGSIALGYWRDCLKQKKLEANPHRMHDDEYRRFNRERFNGK
jgi:hypothetical protein